MSASAERQGRFGLAFGPRFFLGLILGLVWIGPAWWDPRFIWAMAAWDVLVVAAWFIDLRRLPEPGTLEVSRVWFEPLSQSCTSPVAIEVSHAGGGIDLRLEDDVPPSLSAELPKADLHVSPSGPAEGMTRARATYSVQPVERGDIELGRVALRYQSPLKLAERWASAGLTQTVRVYPNLQESRRHAFYLMRSRQIAIEKRFKRQPGMGREFESLRDYRQGDELRDVCWTATARRARLVSKVYRPERSQAVVIVVDAGRLMLARISPMLDSGQRADSQTQNPPSKMSLAKLDYAVTAALSLAEVALYSGDSVGLLAYGRRPQARLGGARGASHLRDFVERLALVKGELVEADHAGAADLLLGEQKRRSLVVWLTDLAETAATPEVIESAARLVGRHLVVFAAIGQPEMGQLMARRPESAEEMYRYIAALEMVQRRELLLRRLRQQGAMALELVPGQLAAGIVNQYLQIKERSLL
ncbi:MAG TPA: DUF58 domain-containing protein [Terriglobia bacterium]|nr:DUF58 domain-containing protein [Terriglobia bacterium]